MCNSGQNIELNICQILERINQCCLDNEELSSIRQQIESVQTWINTFEGEFTTEDVLLKETIGQFPANTSIQVVLEYLYETLNTITPTNKQESIQFKNVGVNLGTIGTVDSINFIGNVNASRVGNSLTINGLSTETNLSIGNRTTTTLDVISSNGTDATIPQATVSLAGLLSSTDKNKLEGIQAGAEVNVQSDWNVLDNTSDAFILNKPTIPSIAGLASISYVDNQDALKQNLLVSGTNIKTINGNSILGSGNLVIAGGGGGETNTASNVGTSGVGVFKQKTGVNLEFKNINAGSNKITVTEDGVNNEIDVDVVVANLTGIAQSQITNLVTDLSNKQETLVSGTNIKTINSTSLLGSGNINIDLSVKQTNIQFQEEGSNLGTSGTVDIINFTGASITASRTGNTLTVDVTGGGGGGATNLGYTSSSTNGVVTSDTGNDATIPLADGTNAGLLSPSQFTKLSNITITQAVDLDQLESDNVTNNAKVSNATHTGDVTGSGVLTLAIVNSNVGTFGSSTQVPQFVVNGKGLITSVSNVNITPAASSITGVGNITKVDDVNVTLTLGGTPVGSVLNGVSFTLGWTGTLADGRIASASNWNSAYSNRITSLTTTGSSGAATLVSNVLNIPNYTLVGLGGQPLDADLTAIASLVGTSGILRKTATDTWALDTNTYLTANQSISLTGEATGTGSTSIGVTLSNSAVISKVLTGFTSSTGTILATDSILQAIQKLDGNLAAATAGGVSSVTGTTNRITSTGGSNPIIDISASYAGQSSITTLGTITTGVWNGTPIGDSYISSASTWNSLVSNATHTGDATGSTSLTVVGINNTNLAGLATGILKNTTGTGVPSIAVAGDFPTLNQNTTGSAATLTTGRTISITGDLSYTSPSFNGSTNITAVGTLATVNSNVGNFGDATQVATFTVNGKGLITAASNISISIPASQISDFSEAADDRIATLIQNGTGITWSYNDVANTLTPTVTITQYTDEAAQDAIGGMIDATLVYADATPLLTRAALTGDITAAQGSNSTTISTNVVTNSKLAQMGAHTFKGNNTGSTANATDLTVPQMQAELSVDDLVTLSGVADGAVNLGTFSGVTIPDNSTIKAAFQSIETTLESNYAITNRQNKIRVVSVNTTLSTTTDGTVVFDTAGTVATLPSPTNELVLVVKNVSNGSITVTGHLDGVAAQTFTVASLESFRFHSNGSTYYIIA